MLRIATDHDWRGFQPDCPYSAVTTDYDVWWQVFGDVGHKNGHRAFASGRHTEVLKRCVKRAQMWEFVWKQRWTRADNVAHKRTSCEAGAFLVKSRYPERRLSGRPLIVGPVLSPAYRMARIAIIKGLTPVLRILIPSELGSSERFFFQRKGPETSVKGGGSLLPILSFYEPKEGIIDEEPFGVWLSTCT